MDSNSYSNSANSSTPTSPSYYSHQPTALYLKSQNQPTPASSASLPSHPYHGSSSNHSVDQSPSHILAPSWSHHNHHNIHHTHLDHSQRPTAAADDDEYDYQPSIPSLPVQSPSSATTANPPTSLLGKRARGDQQQQQHRYLSYQQPQQQGYPPPEKQIKRERANSVVMSNQRDSKEGVASSSSTNGHHDDPMPSTSDFVKKLYKMLEDPNFQGVVSWGPQGDCFVVKDMNEFTKSILPRMFKHSNFASFVRQLNKYDFHKVKNTDDNQFGEHSWTFRHPDFHADRRDALENIKRKVPAQRKSLASQANAASNVGMLGGSPTSMSFGGGLPPQGYIPGGSVTELHNELRRLKDDNEDLKGRLRSLERNYENVLVEMVGFQRGMAQQDGLMQSLIAYFLGSESGKLKQSTSTGNTGSQSNVQSPSLAALAAQVQSHAAARQQALNNTQAQLQQAQLGGSGGPGASASSLLPLLTGSTAAADPNPFLPSHAVQKIGLGIGDPDVGRATLMQMNELSRRAAAAGGISAIAGAGAVSYGPGPGGTASSPSGYTQGSAWGGPSQPQQQPLQQNPGTISSLEQQLQQQGMQPPKMSRAEALARIEEMQRERERNGAPWNGGGSNPDGSSRLSGARRTSMSVMDVEAQQQQQQAQQQQQGPPPVNSLWASLMGSGQQPFSGLEAGGLAIEENPEAMAHEGLQVYTVGHLMPRDAYPEQGSTQGSTNWSFDATGLSGGNLLSGLGVGGSLAEQQMQMQMQQAQQQQQQQQGEDNGNNDDDDDEEVVQPSINTTDENGALVATSSAKSSPKPSSSSALSKAGAKRLRVRRSTFVPGWAVPPRVLLVDDDAISRKISSKFLQVFGCTTDVAVDGVGAVNKMNLEKYDLVLMDIVMPKLDGVSATSIIRQFDKGTPIISMTSNSKPNEIMTYYSNGMTDILPKPFSKQGLLDMLEKHLTHLKAIQQITRNMPRGVGIPPLSDPNFEQALTTNANQALLLQNSSSSLAGPVASTSSGAGSSSSSPSDTTAQGQGQIDRTIAPSPFGFNFFGVGENSMDEGRINPLAGMGLTDEQYNMMLQNIVNGESFMGGLDGSSTLSGALYTGSTDLSAGPSSSSGMKRGLDDHGGADGPVGKKSRFEIVE